MGMDSFIFGIGCSGTTMIYSLLQSIYAGLYGQDFYSTYEPFIWNRERFNRLYKNTGGLFGRTSSISVEGIYNHVKIPMFVDSASSVDYIDNEFLRHFTSTHGPGQPHLTKLCQQKFSGFTTVCEDEISKAEFEHQVRQHPFVMCATGGGLDPSPTAWRSIANGSIPILKSSVLDDAYAQLPVAFVDDWTEDFLSLEKLREWLAELSPYYEPGPLRTETLHKLSLDYWWSRILEGQAY